MPKHPLAEVFGFPYNNLSAEAQRYRRNRLCPYNNHVPSCTKDKANDPLGVCSVFDGDEIAITCPVRFREDWMIAEHAAAFFFPEGTRWTSLTEVRLRDKNGKSAGNIDLVLVAYDKHGKVNDFGAVEVQGVYISGNIRRAFQHYMQDPPTRKNMDWTEEENYPHADYLSSSRKRLETRLHVDGGLIRSWGKRMMIAIDANLFATLPRLPRVKMQHADIAWCVYTLLNDAEHNRLKLTLIDQVYTRYGNISTSPDATAYTEDALLEYLSMLAEQNEV